VLTLHDTIKAITRKRITLERKLDKVSVASVKAKYKGEIMLLDSVLAHLIGEKTVDITPVQREFLEKLMLGYVFRWYTQRTIVLRSAKNKEYMYSRIHIDPLLHLGLLVEKSDYYKITERGVEVMRLIARNKFHTLRP